MQTEQIFLKDYKDIEKVLEQNGVQKPFLCCGKSFEKTQAFELIMQLGAVVFDSIRPNPRFEDMVTATELFVKEGCDFMIAAGGGSPMDSAKMIRLMATNGCENALEQPMEDNGIKALFIPTTSGSGSEATKSSVFYVNENEKLSVANTAFIPHYVLFDEQLLKTVPPYQRRCTCLDALSHSIESFWSVKANGESREYAEKSIRLFFENKDSYINNEAKGNRGMLEASFYGGKAINITGTTAAHAMCYNITMNCATAHGHSVAAGLSEIWEYMLEKELKPNGRSREEVNKIFEELGGIMGAENAADGLKIFNSLIGEFGLEKPRADKSLIPGFVSKVNVSRLGNNPYALDANDIEEIYTRILL